MQEQLEKNYRAGVGIILINSEKKVFCGNRIDNPDAWQMPQGGVDDDEDLLLAAKRELEEETSVKNIELIAESNDFYQYELPQEWIDRLWSGKYVGQKQKWFLFKCLKPEEINVKTTEPEFLSWQWQNQDFLINNIVEFKKKLYKSLFEEFKPFL
jgi:putative (di)nucleoside polyphosphate hydrolase